MPRTRPSDLGGSYVDEWESEDEDHLKVSSTSTSPKGRRSVSSIHAQNGRAIRRTSSKVSSPYQSTFSMPRLEHEVPTPKARRRKADTNITTPQVTPPEKSKRQNNIMVDGAHYALTTTLGWLFDVVLGSLQVIKTPLKYALGIYLLFGLAIIVSNAATSRLSAALTPICRLPGSSIILPSLCQNPMNLDFGRHANEVEPEFDHLMQIQSKFEDLLQHSVDYYAVPAFMKHSQSAMRDVREVVRYSPLKSKNELLLEFDTFVNAASQASWDLESFNSHIGRTVDRIMLTARWTQKTLDEIAEPNVTRGFVGKAVDALMSPFQPVKYTEDAVLDLYIKHSDEVQHEISDLLTEAQAVFSLLKSLEDTIDSIHGITARDTYYAKLGRDEVLAELWSRLGGNRKQKAMFASQLKVLKQISAYGQTAYTSIAGAILKLQTMSAEIDQLRERLGNVETAGKQRVPLSVHLENIQMGVERLEEARGIARDARMEKSRAVLSAGRERFGDDVHQLPGKRAELPSK